MTGYSDYFEDCIKKLGDPFMIVHQWLDEFAGEFDGRLEHRDFRHHREGIEEVRRRWGDGAAKAAELHILLGWANLISAAEIPKDAKEAAALRKDVPRLLSQKRRLSPLEKMLQKQTRRRRITTTRTYYSLRLFRRKPGTKGTSMKCFDWVYGTGGTTLACIDKQLRRFHPEEYSGYVVVRDAVTRGGGTLTWRRLERLRAYGDVPRPSNQADGYSFVSTVTPEGKNVTRRLRGVKTHGATQDG